MWTEGCLFLGLFQIPACGWLHWLITSVIFRKHTCIRKSSHKRHMWIAKFSLFTHMYQKELTQKVHVNRKAFSVRLMAHFILLCSLAINHSFIATFVPLQMFSIAQSVIDHTSFVSRWVRFLLLLLFLIIFFPFRMQSIVVLSSFRWIRVVLLTHAISRPLLARFSRFESFHSRYQFSISIRLFFCSLEWMSSWM